MSGWLTGAGVSWMHLLRIWMPNLLEDSIPHIIDSHRLHTSAVGAGLHFSQEEAGVSRWMMPDRDVLWIIKRIGSVFGGTCRSEDGDDGRADCRCQVHGTAVIPDEKDAGLNLSGGLSEARFACQIDH
jgi:hypothetical protein